MPIVTPSDVARITGLPLGTDGKDGACEKAASVSVEAENDARRIMGSSAYAAAIAYEDSAAVAEIERYSLFSGAIAGLAFARIAPTLGPLRATAKGGFTTEVGADQMREGLMNMNDVLALAGQVRDRAASDLKALADEIAADSVTDTTYPVEPLYIC